MNTIKNADCNYRETRTFRALSEQCPDVVKIASFVIHRLNNPKPKGKAQNWNDAKPFRVSRDASLEARQRPRLSPEDEREVFAVVGLCFSNSRYFENKRVPWLSIFRHARHTLRMGLTGTKRETHNQDAVDAGIETQVSLTLSPSEREIMLQRHVPQIRRMAREIRAAYQHDPSRKREAAKKSALLFLRFLVSNLKGDSGIGRADVLKSDTTAALHERAKDFKAYLARGAMRLAISETITERAPAELPAGTHRSFAML